MAAIFDSLVTLTSESIGISRSVLLNVEVAYSLLHICASGNDGHL